MSISPIEECKICQNNPLLKGIVANISMVQRSLVSLWKSSQAVKVEGDYVSAEMMVMEKDIVTFIPSYNVYNDYWQTAMLVNPVMFNFKDFDIHRDWDKSYITLVFATMEEQLLIWMIDDDTRKSTLFAVIEAFKNALEDLYIVTHNLPSSQA